jgi:hypothetical protein
MEIPKYYMKMVPNLSIYSFILEAFINMEKCERENLILRMDMNIGENYRVKNL